MLSFLKWFDLEIEIGKVVRNRGKKKKVDRENFLFEFKIVVKSNGWIINFFYIVSIMIMILNDKNYIIFKYCYFVENYYRNL